MTTDLNLDIPDPDVIEPTPLTQVNDVYREAPRANSPMQPATPSL